MAKPKIAVFKFTSCSGCQLQILNVESHLLDLLGEVDISFFPMATRSVRHGPYDIGFVEGSVSAPEEIERLQEARRECRSLVALGSCAYSGGLQALKNWVDAAGLKAAVYPDPSKIKTLDQAREIDHYVKVDGRLRGCPINQEQFVDFVAATLRGKQPDFGEAPVCVQCKLNDNICLLVSRGEPCLGPVTQAGCGAICLSHNRACYGCFGPHEDINAPAMIDVLRGLGLSGQEILRKFRHINSNAEGCREGVNLIVSQADARRISGAG